MIGAILWGGTGQSRVVRPILEAQGISVLAVVDDTEGLVPSFTDIPLLVGKAQFEPWLTQQKDARLGFCVSIGNPHAAGRIRIAAYLKQLGLKPCNAIHPTAIIEPGVVLGEGVQIMAGAVIGVNVKIGNYCIINTKASVDHDTVLEDGVEIAPGATLCGQILVKAHTWVGAGATVLPRIEIGENTIIGGGALVSRNIPANVVAYGVPAKPQRGH